MKRFNIIFKIYSPRAFQGTSDFLQNLVFKALKLGKTSCIPLFKLKIVCGICTSLVESLSARAESPPLDSAQKFYHYMMPNLSKQKCLSEAKLSLFLSMIKMPYLLNPSTNLLTLEKYNNRIS